MTSFAFLTDDYDFEDIEVIRERHGVKHRTKRVVGENNYSRILHPIRSKTSSSKRSHICEILICQVIAGVKSRSARQLWLLQQG
jgi:hypothetical protein